MNLEIRENKSELHYYYNSQLIYTRDTIAVKTPGKILTYPLFKNENVISANFCNIAEYKEELVFSDNAIKGKITLAIKTDDPFIVSCPFSFPKTETKPYFMIPGFLYGTNNLEKSNGPHPKLNYGGPVDWPNSSLLYTRADRSTHPGVITVKDNIVNLIGISEKLEGAEYNTNDVWAPRYPYNGLMIDTSNKEVDAIGFMLGYEHAPKRYTLVWDDPKTPREDEYLMGWLYGLKGKTLTAEVFYYVDDAKDLRDYSKALKWYYNQIHQTPRKRSERADAIKMIADVIVNETWMPEDVGFLLCDNEDGRQQSPIAWTGGIQVAYPLLKAAKKTNNKKYEEIACKYIDHLCEQGMNKKAGFLYEEKHFGKWTVTGWWGKRENCLNFGDNPMHCGYINGQTSYYLLKSYLLTGKKNPAWFETAKTVIDSALKTQLGNGYIPCFFDPVTGEGKDFEMFSNGFMSCWFVPGAALIYQITGDKKYLLAADKAIRHYNTYHQKGELYGTPMDTFNAVDEEGNLSYICGTVELHKTTKDQKYIDLAMDGLHYEFSWKFAYNTVFSNEPLRSMKWPTSGGSITSNHNPHIHQMGNIIAGELLYLYEQTKDKYIADRLRDTCIWGLGSYNTKDNDFGFGKAGHSTEEFFYSDGILLPWWRPHDGGVWEANLPWSSACPLLSCSEDIPDKFFNN
jgi:hypothetical protein